jgi:hypothetical protein
MDAGNPANNLNRFRPTCLKAGIQILDYLPRDWIRWEVYREIEIFFPFDWKLSRPARRALTADRPIPENSAAEFKKLNARFARLENKTLSVLPFVVMARNGL